MTNRNKMKSNSVFKRRIMFYAITIVSFLSAIVVPPFFIPILLFHPCSLRNTWIAGIMLRLYANLFGIKYELEGFENNYGDDAAVIVSNHQFILDFLAFGNLEKLGNDICMVMKQKIFYYGPFGLGAWLIGCIGIDRTNPENGRRKLQRALDIIKIHKAKLWIFPEGTTNRSDDLSNFLSFKKGAFHIAVDGQMPIIPMVFSPYTFIDFRARLFEPGTVRVCALPRISTAGLTKEDIPELIESIREQMRTKYLEMRKQMDINIDQNGNTYGKET